MRKIEQKMQQAIENGENFSEGNTKVKFSNAQTLGVGSVFLHDNLIAIIMDNGEVRPVHATYRQYPTATTTSRLRALGVNAAIRQHQPTIDGQVV